MRVIVPERSSGRLPGAWRACVGTGRFELAEVTLVEVTPIVTDETPPWWDPSHLFQEQP